MRPKKADDRAVRIRRLIGELMVTTMHGDPARRRILHTAYRQNDMRIPAISGIRSCDE